MAIDKAESLIAPLQEHREVLLVSILHFRESIHFKTHFSFSANID